MIHKIIGGKNAQGKKEWKKVMKKQHLTRKEAILAQCYECQNGYSDGIKDCKCFECPIYEYHPYRKNEGAVTP